MTTITKQHRLSVARAWEGDEPTSLFFRTWIDGGLMGSWPTAQETIHMLERLAQLVADAEAKPLPETELVTQLTAVMREADRKFEKVGGSTRHHVRDCLVPELEAAGLAVVRLPNPPEQP